MEVTKLQEDLETMQPLLEQAAIETEETMIKIKVDTVMKDQVFEFFADKSLSYPPATKIPNSKRFSCSYL